MPSLDARLLVLEQRTDRTGELPAVVPDDCTDEEIARARRTGRKVFRESDPAFVDEFV